MKTTLLALSLRTALPAGPARAAPRAAEGAAPAADHGCLNCHGVRTLPHEAPLLRDMAARLGRRGDADEATRHPLHGMREKLHVHGHPFVSDESALAILRCMAQGAALR